MKLVLMGLVALVLSGCGTCPIPAPVPPLPPVVQAQKPVMVGAHGCKLYPLVTPEGGSELWEICKLSEQYRVRPEEIGYR